MMQKHHTYWKSNLRKQFSVLAFAVVLFSFMFDFAAPHFLVDGDQDSIVELLGEEEAPKEDTEKEKEKEEDEKLDDMKGVRGLYAPYYMSLLHSLSESSEHQHFESVPTPPPDLA